MIPTDLPANEFATLLPWIDDNMAEEAGGWLWQTDEQHRFVYMSPGVARIAGRPVDWHYGRTRQELGNVSLGSSEAAEWLRVLDRRELFGPLEFVRFEHGRVVRMRTLGYPVIDRLGRFRGYRGIAFRVSGEDTMAEGSPRAPRLKATLHAELTLPDTRLPIFCTTRDISELGACLELPCGQQLPDRFDLRVHNEGTQTATQCEVRWRRGGLVGVRFILGIE